MMVSEFYALRCNLLGGMDDYIRNVIGDDYITEVWNDRGIEDSVDEDILLNYYAKDDEVFKQVCYLFGNLIAGFTK